jgi:hypothetical protein
MLSMDFLLSTLNVIQPRCGIAPVYRQYFSKLLTLRAAPSAGGGGGDEKTDRFFAIINNSRG